MPTLKEPHAPRPLAGTPGRGVQAHTRPVPVSAHAPPRPAGAAEAAAGAALGTAQAPDRERQLRSTTAKEACSGRVVQVYEGGHDSERALTPLPPSRARR